MSLTTFIKSTSFAKILNESLYQSFFIKAIINYKDFTITQNPKNNLYILKINKSKLINDFKFFNWNYYAILGTAIDYFIRLEIFKKQNPLLIDFNIFMKNTISQRGITLLEQYYKKTKDNEALKIIIDYEKIITNLKINNNSHLYLNSLLKLSFIDSYYRQDFKSIDIKKYFLLNNQNYLENVLLENINFLRNIFISEVKETDKILYNPEFDFFSQLFSGADADLIINDKLIDFKSTAKNIINFADLWQISFYAYFYITLNKIKDNGIPLNIISLYFTQYDLHINLDIKKLEPIFKIISLICNVILEEKN